jgi:peptidyl-tRNA hydrolase
MPGHGDPSNSQALSRIHPEHEPHAPGTQPGRRPHLPIEPHSDAHTDKTYIVTRADLSHGQQIAQAVHAMSLLPQHDPQAYTQWRATSDSIVVLAAPSEQALIEITQQARATGISHATWREPDLGDETTAIILAPGPNTPGLLAHLPLAGKTEPPAGTGSREAGLRRLTTAMTGCEQTPGMNVLEHGRAVRETYLALLDHANKRADLNTEPGWRLPEWLTERGTQLAAHQVTQTHAEQYLTLHDCGKPAVRVIDDTGRSRFPEHAAASERAYRRTLRKHASETVAWLIANDMAIHTAPADQLTGPDGIANHPGTPTLLLAAIAEVHANAAMFGGTSSDSFKAKIKRVDQRGRALIRHWDTHGWPQTGGECDSTTP